MPAARQSRLSEPQSDSLLVPPAGGVEAGPGLDFGGFQSDRRQREGVQQSGGCGHVCRGQSDDLAGDDGDSSTYDAENRVSTVTEGGAVVQYSYDGNGRRVMKAICASGANPGTAAVSGAVVSTMRRAIWRPSMGRPRTAGRSMCMRMRWGALGWRHDGAGVVTRCLDYTPFGQELPAGVGRRGRACAIRFSNRARIGVLG